MIFFLRPRSRYIKSPPECEIINLTIIPPNALACSVFAYLRLAASPSPLPRPTYTIYTYLTDEVVKLCIQTKIVFSRFRPVLQFYADSGRSNPSAVAATSPLITCNIIPLRLICDNEQKCVRNHEIIEPVFRIILYKICAF